MGYGDGYFATEPSTSFDRLDSDSVVYFLFGDAAITGQTSPAISFKGVSGQLLPALLVGFWAGHSNTGAS